jgi:hypothetical protein
MSSFMWHCPVCMRVVLDGDREYSRFDYMCPGCGVKRLSEFEIGAGPLCRIADETDPADWWKAS